MPFYLWELFTPSDLMQAILDGYVREQKHPTAPYRILNYTEKAVFDKRWDAITLNCRGLIIDNDFRVVARPFKKFFNYSEHDNDVLGNLPKLNPHAEVLVTDKMDGSLGILYPLPDGEYAVATRGSFTSPQALHATEVWQRKYAATAGLDPSLTYLVEIIYPENRIVCDYNGLDDLVLLGAVHIESGYPTVFPSMLTWDGPRATVFGFSSLADALTAEPRPGAEGLVVTFVNDCTMVKIKQEDYIILHKLVTGLSKRTVWEALGSGQSVEDVCLPLPDEFHGWVREVAAELLAKRDEILETARATHESMIEDIKSRFGLVPGSRATREFRAIYAEYVSRHSHRPWLFMLLDGKDPAPKIWQTLKPEGLETPFNGEETNDD